VTDSHEALLKRYLQFTERLEAATIGLSESEVDLTKGEGWSIRQYVHPTVEGELIWQIFLRAIVGRDGIEFPISWYFGLPQEEWAQRWVYDKRTVEPTLALFRSLVYFGDAEKDDIPQMIEKVPWREVKGLFQKESHSLYRSKVS
jgi:hypothetical protein